MSWRVLVTSRLFDETREAVEILERAGCEVVIPNPTGRVWEQTHVGEKLVAALDGIDATICGAPEMTRAVLERTTTLKLISRRGVGYDSIDVEAARERGIAVTITAGANHEAVADHVFALLLASARHLFDAHRDVVDERWAPRMGVGLFEKTFGIVGLGRIGKAVARRARGFSMKILAADPVRDDAFSKAHGVRYVELDELLASADFVSINASLNPQSRHLIDARAFSKMKPSAILVNTARGPLVEEAALVEALRTWKIAAAGIDVFEAEPLGRSELLALPNVILTPHNAGSTDDSYRHMNVMAAETVVRVMRGELPNQDCLIVPPRALAP